MADRGSPATSFHAVTVINEQTRRLWQATGAFIHGGNVVVTGLDAPDGIFDAAASTFTVSGTDAAERYRAFPHLVVDLAASDPPSRVVFR